MLGTIEHKASKSFSLAKVLSYFTRSSSYRGIFQACPQVVVFARIGTAKFGPNYEECQPKPHLKFEALRMLSKGSHAPVAATIIDSEDAVTLDASMETWCAAY